ncbi:hypothetical protein JNM87_00235 [Candidatus Saccharibacteria bacterium]|nr:hypothetical protein [Candidatus Saccharibacteria bacterium]
MANSKTPPTKPVAVRHRVRTFFSSIFGFFALGLIIMSILVVWLDRTLTDTQTYVKTVAPLVTKPGVQNFVVTKASSTLLDNHDAPIRDIASQLLTPEQIAGKTDEQLKAEVTPLVQESLRSVVSSPTFANLWKTNNESIHSQLMTQLQSGSQTLNLDFHPLITGLIDQLGTTKLSFVKDKLDIPADAGKVKLEGRQLENVRRVYDYFKKAMLAILVCAALSVGLCVLISVHHLKTIRRIALLTGIFCGVLAALLGATSLIRTGSSEVDNAFARTLVDGITHDLRLSLIVIAVLGIGGAVASKLYSVITSSRSSTAKRA